MVLSGRKIIVSLLLTTYVYPMEKVEKLADVMEKVSKIENSVEGASNLKNMLNTLSSIANSPIVSNIGTVGAALVTLYSLKCMFVNPGEINFKPTIPTKKFADFAPNSVPDKIRALAYFLNHEHEAGKDESDIELPLGVLLSGQPGTGKSSLVEALAGETDCTFFSTSASEFINVWQGSGPANLKKLFSTALKYARERKRRSLVLIDEIEGLGGNRASASTYQEDLKTIDEALKQFDLANKSKKVIVFATTNIPQGIDKALVRSGRFDWNIEISLPDKAQRIVLLQFYIDKLSQARRQNIQNEDIVALSELTNDEFSPADIQLIVKDAKFAALNQPLTVQHFQSAIRDIIAGKRIKNLNYLIDNNNATL